MRKTVGPWRNAITHPVAGESGSSFLCHLSLPLSQFSLGPSCRPRTRKTTSASGKFGADSTETGLPLPRYVLELESDVIAARPSCQCVEPNGGTNLTRLKTCGVRENHSPALEHSADTLSLFVLLAGKCRTAYPRLNGSP